MLLAFAPSLCSDDPHGMWVPFDGVCQPPRCAGTINSTFTLPNSAQSYIFQPFSCYYKFFSRAEARKCWLAAQPILMGDSRMRYLQNHIRYWLQDVPVDRIANEWPAQFGLDFLLQSEGMADIYQAVLQGRTIIMNSILHDLAEFGRFSSTLTRDARRFFGLSYCGGCNQTLTVACDCNKPFPPERYLANMKRLREVLKAAQKEREQTLGRPMQPLPFFWVTMHRKPPYPRDNIYPWHSNDVLYEFEGYAERVMSEAGVTHINMRPHQLASPPEWWEDFVHYGTNETSLFQHISLQIILNRICST